MKNKYHFFTCLFFLITFFSYAQFGPQQVITTEASTAQSVFAADLDGDNDMDVISSSSGDDKVAWYENLDGLGNFGLPQEISVGIEDLRKIYATDLDGDDDIDVLATSLSEDKVVWFENLDGLGNFGPQNVITTLTNGSLSVFAADLDGDNDMDVLSASHIDNKVAWYKNIDGEGTFSNQIIISNTALSVRIVYAADIDGDNDMDVLAGTQGTAEIIWYENLDGQGTFSTANVISNMAIGINSIRTADIDGDDDLDVIASEGIDDSVTWFENLDGLGNFGPEQIISDNVDAARDVFLADFDNDNDLDVLSASQADDKVAWYENVDGLGTFGPQQIISTEADGPRSVFAVDLDGDNDMDVLSASIVDDKIAWYENLTLIGVNDFSEESVTILPSPVSDFLTINNTSTNQIKTIKIYDVLGRLVLQEKEQFKSIDVSHLNRGLLFVKLETTQGSMIKKVVKE